MKDDLYGEIYESLGLTVAAGLMVAAAAGDDSDAEDIMSDEEKKRIAAELVQKMMKDQGFKDLAKQWEEEDNLKKNKPATNLGWDPDALGEIVKEELEAMLDEKRKKKQQKGKKRAAKKAKRKKKKSGKKDACYHKVKARYDVWPSAYASGALVKCRKVGASNWGNSKKEQLQATVEDELTKVLQERNGANVPVTGRQIANYWVDSADGLKHGYLNYVDALEQSEQGVQPPFQRVPNWLTPEIIKEHTQEIARQMSQDIKNVSAQTVEELGQALVASLNESNSIEDLVYYTLFEVLEEKKRKKKRKLTAKPSSETSLRDWFGRKGAKGKKGGWVDCNTCRKDKKTGRKKCSACGRSGGEKRSKYPSCRPTPSACGKRGKWGKKSKRGKKG